MKIIILGGNQVGGTLAENLVHEQHDITVVDTNDQLLQSLNNRFDIQIVHGSGSLPSVLKTAGADDADMLIAVTNNDEVNLVACQVAHSIFNLPTKIARIRTEDYFSYPTLFSHDDLPVDVFIRPEALVTELVQSLIEFPGALQVLNFAKNRVKLVAIKPYFGGQMVGKTISTLRRELKIDFKVVAIYRENHAVIPNGDTTIEIGDEVFFIAESSKIKKVMGALRRVDASNKHILIASGNDIGKSIAEKCERSYEVKVIEESGRRAHLLANALNRAVVLHGDPSDRDLLINENIDQMDVFCAVSDDDEANIMACMLAKNLGVRTVMALIKRGVYVDLVESSHIDIAISPQQATISRILRYVRRGDIHNVHSLRKGAAEAIEIVAHGDAGSSRVVGRAIRDLPISSDIMIGAIVRDDEVIMSTGDLVIETNDQVILFVTNKKRIRDVEKLFQVSLGFFG
jgi:trk system potassium uptake protein